jgi:putative DNA primase/helicase
VLTDFHSFARAHGLLIDHVIADGRIHRCATEGHERKKNGAWMFDGRRGWVHCWDGEAVTHYFNDPDSKPWSEGEKRALAQQRLARYRREQERHARAATEARTMLQRATWEQAPYMLYKGFKERLPRHTKPEWRHGYMHVVDGAMFIPMFSLAGDIVGAQLIRWLPDEQRHEKKMHPGTRAKGAVFRFGNDKAASTWLCEGFATALSIKMALEQMRFPDAVVCCFSDSNLVHVAPHIPGRKFVFADNDASGAGERAAKATGLAYCMSDIEGYDANDLHMDEKRGGLFAVQRLIQKARAAA